MIDGKLQEFPRPLRDVRKRILEQMNVPSGAITGLTVNFHKPIFFHAKRE
jgi:hypothetical protein